MVLCDILRRQRRLEGQILAASQRLGPREIRT